MVVLRSSFNVLHNLGARNLKDFFPKDVVLTRGNCNLFVPLRPLVLVLGGGMQLYRQVWLLETTYKPKSTYQEVFSYSGQQGPAFPKVPHMC